MKLEAILGSGYFPRELPPPFTTKSFASTIRHNIGSLPSKFQFQSTGNVVSEPSTHNLARTGTLRRKLSIPNPISYFQLSSSIVDSWKQLYGQMNQSSFSLSKPQEKSGTKRAVVRIKDFSYLPHARARCRAGARYILTTDINAYYPSLYTHSIPWAIHTKSVAKINHSLSLVGNKLDKLIRDGQDQQTIGIPIGPDTSLVIAELVLSTIDESLEKSIGRPGFRYIDDYELGFSSYSDAESALATLQGFLSEYELQLNPRKTKIIELPTPLEAPWASELRVFPFRARETALQNDLVRYFGRAFEISRENQEDAVLNYAISRLRNIHITQATWELYEDLLLQCVIVEPGTVRFVVEELFRYHDASYKIDRDRTAETFSQVMKTHSPIDHGSEVAWVLWGHLILDMPIDDETARCIAKMHDSVVAILALDARSKGLIKKDIKLDLWQSFVTGAELYRRNWLVAYECSVKQWLKSLDGKDFVSKDPCFGFLKGKKVSFYNQTLSKTYKPEVTTVIPGVSPAIEMGMGDLAYG